MTVPTWGVILIAIGIAIFVLWGIYRWWIALELYRLKESVTFVSPADPKVRTFPVYGGIHDWEAEGEL